MRKSFGGVHALRGVNLEVAVGEVHALIGENGAGKSTLIKVLTGAHTPDEGRIDIQGVRVEEFSPSRARAMGVAAVYQQPALFGDLTVAENLGLRLETGGLWRLVDWRYRRTRAAALLEKLGGKKVPVDARVSELGMAQQQLVEIAAAIGSRAKVIIFDEPTASIGSEETEDLFEVIRHLKRGGVGMVYVSHRLEELPRIADRVTVLRDGAYVGTRDMHDVDRAELIRLMVGRNVESLFPKIDVSIGETVLRLNQVSCAAGGVHDITLDVRAGEIMGLAGLVGAGRTELARVLFGLTPADAGEISVAGQRVNLTSPIDAVRAGIAYVPEDRRRHGVVLDMSVAENTTLAVLRNVATRGIISTGRETALAEDYVRKLGTKTAGVNIATGTLSGGNQQKVALARWLATRPKVLILDEPTQGVDVGAKAEIHRIIGEMAKQGMAILLISSEMPEVLGMSDRVAVMAGGRVRGILSRDQATPEAVLKLALPENAALAGGAA